MNPLESQEYILSRFGTDYREVAVGRIAYMCREAPLLLECGAEISNFPLAFQSWGELNAEKSNVILICHALTGDQYALGTHPVTGKPGWWESMVGPGKPIDTSRFFVLCVNVLGGCMGSYSPKTPATEGGVPLGLDFPVITIGDMVRAQAALLDAMGIGEMFCVIGGSMGGMQVLEWAARYPQRVRSAIPIATAARHTAQNIAFHEIGRQAIMADPRWCDGRYAQAQEYPVKGLSVARMTAHITYLSEEALQRKFGRTLQGKEAITFGFDADFQVESYLRHQGMTFVERFDPNAYLYITRAMDYFDLAAERGGRLAEVFHGIKTRFCVVSFSSDWLFPTSESRHLVRALAAAAANVSFTEIRSDKGHDAFLLDDAELASILRGFLLGMAK
jgi:homoserine O-acetyltransferase